MGGTMGGTMKELNKKMTFSEVKENIVGSPTV